MVRLELPIIDYAFLKTNLCIICEIAANQGFSSFHRQMDISYDG